MFIFDAISHCLAREFNCDLWRRILILVVDIKLLKIFKKNRTQNGCTWLQFSVELIGHARWSFEAHDRKSFVRFGNFSQYFRISLNEAESVFFLKTLRYLYKKCHSPWTNSTKLPPKPIFRHLLLPPLLAINNENLSMISQQMENFPNFVLFILFSLYFHSRAKQCKCSAFSTTVG